jgi:hypothetical protein
VRWHREGDPATAMTIAPGHRVVTLSKSAEIVTAARF